MFRTRNKSELPGDAHRELTQQSIHNNESPDGEFLGQIYYKCQMCGGYCYMGDPFRINKKAAEDLLIEVVKNQMFMGNPYLYKAPMQVKHDCPDGSVGLAYFAGIRKVGK